MKPHDTDDAAWAVQVDIWRRMGPTKRVELALRMSDEVRELTRSGIRARHPEYSEDDVKHAAFRIFLGDELYQKAWPNHALMAP